MRPWHDATEYVGPHRMDLRPLAGFNEAVA